jgi:hypothetical protein
MIESTRMSEAQFTAATAARCQALEIVAAVSVQAPLVLHVRFRASDATNLFSLDNFYAAYCMDGDFEKLPIAEHLTGLAEMICPVTWLEAQKRLRIRIYHMDNLIVRYMDGLTFAPDVKVSPTASVEPLLICRTPPFDPQLRAVAFVDYPNHTRLVQHVQLAEWGVTEADIWAVAETNTRSVFEASLGERHNRLWLRSDPDACSASLALMIDVVAQRMNRPTDAGFWYAAIPHRDCCVATWEPSMSRFAQFQLMTRAIYDQHRDQHGSYLISPRAYIYAGGRRRWVDLSPTVYAGLMAIDVARRN